MILDGKYIMTTKNNYIKVLDFLYSKGYIWINKEYKEQFMRSLVTHDFMYIYSYDNIRIDWNYNEVPYDRKEININILLREDKLKQILK